MPAMRKVSRPPQGDGRWRCARVGSAGTTRCTKQPGSALTLYSEARRRAPHRPTTAQTETRPCILGSDGRAGLETARNYWRKWVGHLVGPRASERRRLFIQPVKLSAKTRRQRLWPMNELVRHVANAGSRQFCQTWPKWVGIQPRLVGFAPTLAEIAQHWPASREFGRNRQNFAEISRDLVGVAPNRPKSPEKTEFAPK